MSAEIIQFRDYQNPRDLERMNAELEKQAIEIAINSFPHIFAPWTVPHPDVLAALGPNPLYHAPESDPA